MAHKTSPRRRRDRAATAFAAAALFASLCFAAAGAHAQGGGYSCVWSTLPGPTKARLELSARLGAPPIETLLERRGEAGVSNLLTECGVPLDAQSVERAARYLSARTRASVLEAELAAFGLSRRQREIALEAFAPAADRVSLAEEIMALQTRATAGGAAAAAVTGAAGRLADLGPPLGRANRVLAAAEWAAAKILSDGLAAGAAPPPSE